MGYIIFLQQNQPVAKTMRRAGFVEWAKAVGHIQKIKLYIKKIMTNKAFLCINNIKHIGKSEYFNKSKRKFNGKR
ncbi:MAG: hypothetical protein WCS30_12130 [Selenomonadaceae bacterium]